MQAEFFPRKRQFWLYHGTALAVGLPVTVGMAAGWGYMPSYQIATSLAWLPLYTLAALGFRWLYLRHAGPRAGMGRLIAAAVLYSAVAGALMGAILHSAIAPLFWDALLARYPRFTADYSGFLVQRIVADLPQNQMFLLVWGFIYVSVTASRRERDAELSNLRLQHNLKQAQLSSLSNQLNPHFLFNSLNNIRFMIHEDARRADSMITAFAEILRYSLDSSLHAKVSLGDELCVIEKYLAIVGVQLEQRMDAQVRVVPTLHGMLVPPMLLHMLVENAIKHGLEQLPQGGTLAVDARTSDGQLLLTVVNDAPPVPQPYPGAERPGLGIGLSNIAQRLELLYGTSAALAVTHAAGRFSVVLSLPMESAA